MDNFDRVLKVIVVIIAPIAGVQNLDDGYGLADRTTGPENVTIGDKALNCRTVQSHSYSGDTGAMAFGVRHDQLL